MAEGENWVVGSSKRTRVGRNGCVLRNTVARGARGGRRRAGWGGEVRKQIY